MDLVLPIVIIAVVGILAVEAFGDELYRPIGRAVLSHLSGGRFPSASPGMLERLGVAVVGLGAIVLALLLLLGLITLIGV
ncbi:MAG: hypothetical protein ACODAE_06170 [Gemmatimonadota bacterium]